MMRLGGGGYLARSGEKINAKVVYLEKSEGKKSLGSRRTGWELGRRNMWDVILRGYAMAPLVEALRYKPECRGFDFLWGYWDFH
jgi:hypothetical protein